MEKRVEIGNTGLRVTPIGFGANTIGAHNLFQDIDEEVSRQTVREVLSAGADFFDSAFMYGLGRSEELIGEILAETGRRSDVVLATKATHIVTDSGIKLDNSPAFLTEAVDIALKRLQTDYIDLFYIHFPDGVTPPDEAVGALKRLKEAGKIRAIGVSNFSMEALKVANKDGYVDVVQDKYSLVYPELERDMIPYCIEQGISFIPYTPLASGLLTGKFTANNPPQDFRKERPHFQGQAYLDTIAKVDSLQGLADKHHVSIANIVLATTLGIDGIDVVIPGAKSPEQVRANMKTLDADLTHEEVEQVRALFK
ncbi:oxidoreductase [Listeria newyorkensis]|uniref:Oxidoreductase n=1 Tax=Listeria newyorkensis TaxID=1497681 RepID=A0ABX4XP43_9LIST|nr:MULTISPECIES: aldo/keto reductase [Listeria]KGL45151.1 oxidoreductase [Listeriaceae bacterium FSL A5-0209]KGL40046.1 oxidoreductase [Listeria newyorkensis]PNP93328.1 oxidoreductase [Listeria newyorkensis]RQW68213.1 aldo/keto reductase [Listeria sp. SHR_NRA_18]WAO21228.1 aldo/keto reductase [Listeria newyorkensis]